MSQVTNPSPVNSTLPGSVTRTTLPGGNTSITGTVGGDRIEAVPQDKSINSGRGNDVVATGGSSADVHGGKGNDSVLATGNGSPTLSGDQGDDTIVNVGSGNVSMQGGEGNDYLVAKNKDTLRGGQGNDIAIGGTGPATILGDLGNDVINGGSGSETLYGGKGDDTVNGGEGDDLIYGDQGNNILAGGGGKDTFVYQQKNFGKEVDNIIDFVVGDDKIRLSGFGNLSASNITIADGAQAAPGQVVYDSAKGQLYINGQLAMQLNGAPKLTSSNFEFF